MSGILEQIDARLERIEARLAKCAAEPLPGALVDQSRSPLGRRRHCAAVRRMVAEGDARAAVIGRKHLMTEDALRAELSRVSLAPPANDGTPAEASAYQRALDKALAL